MAPGHPPAGSAADGRAADDERTDDRTETRAAGSRRRTVLPLVAGRRLPARIDVADTHAGVGTSSVTRSGPCTPASPDDRSDSTGPPLAHTLASDGRDGYRFAGDPTAPRLGGNDAATFVDDDG